MKKLVSGLLLFIILFCLSACGEEKPVQLQYDSFFSEDHLNEFHMHGLPIPELQNSALNEDGTCLYLNLPKEDYLTYAYQVADYLLERPDVYNRGIWYSDYLVSGPLFIPMNVDEYIPLEDNLDFSDPDVQLAYSMEEDLGGGMFSLLMRDAYSVSIKYNPGMIKGSDFSYTGYIAIGKAERATYDTCAKEHKYGQWLSYPVPATDIAVYVARCEYCGSDTLKDYSYGDFRSEYSKTLASGGGYLEWECLRAFQVNPKGYWGSQQEIRVTKLEGTEFQVLVNGIPVPLTYEEDGCLVYGFTMPDCDVEVEVIGVRIADQA